MRIFVATDISVVASDGHIFANQKHSTILRRYYDAFGKMVICSRIAAADSTTSSFEDISDIVDCAVEVQSLYKMFLNGQTADIENNMKGCDLVICRCPAISAFKASNIARRLGIPYLAEAMGDPWDAYWNHGIQGKAIAPYMFFKMKDVLKHADYATYVTSQFLQRRYPCDKESVAASDVVIGAVDENVFAERARRVRVFDKREITLMTTAAIDVWYKGQQYVIKAIKALNEQGIKVKYLIVGEGDRTYLQAVADAEGVSSQVEFPGRLPLDRVFDVLDTVDLYIQPSLQEGLPRAVIEAMSRGCVCIGARTAGLPELLDEEMLVKRKSVADIADRIIHYCEMSETKKLSMARRNFDEAKKYAPSVLDERRNAYFSEIRRQLSNKPRVRDSEICRTN